jgi:hypothetical protein
MYQEKFVILLQSNYKKEVMKFLSCLLFVLALSSCASYQTGGDVMHISGDHPENTPLTGYIDEAYSTESYTLLQFQFGNYTTDWRRIKKISLDMITPAGKKAQVVLGQDLNDWSDAISHKIAIDDHNKAVLFGAIAATGAALAVSGMSKGNFSQSKAGLALMSGTVAIQSVDQFVTNLDNLQRSQIIPRGHLYSPISIPAGLVVKKWILLKIQKEDIPNKIQFDITYENDKKAKYELKLKDTQ